MHLKHFANLSSTTSYFVKKGGDGVILKILSVVFTFVFFRCLQATVGGIHPSQPPVIRISAIRAVYSYCDFLKQSENTQILVPFLPNIAEGLVAVATQFSSDVLSLCLECLSIVLSVSMVSKITQWAKSNQDGSGGRSMFLCYLP